MIERREIRCLAEQQHIAKVDALFYPKTEAQKKPTKSIKVLN